MPSTAQITPSDITGMVRHWLDTPPDGYLGSSYGADVRSLLQRPQHDHVALTEFLAKMRRDLPILGQLPSEAVSVWMGPNGHDRVVLHVQVIGTVLTAGGVSA